MPRSSVVAQALVFALLAPLSIACVAAEEQANAESPAKDPGVSLDEARVAMKWDEPEQPTRIVGPIHFVGTKGLSSWLIATPAGHIMLNSGMPGSGPMIAESIRKLGLKPEEIRIMLTGHAHCDHIGGHEYLQKLSGARVAAMAQEVDLIQSGGKLDFRYGAYQAFAFEPVKVDQVLNDGDTIELGGAIVTALLTPGHTKGTTTFAMDVADGTRTYKVVFPDGTSVNPGYRLVKDPSYPGIADDYARTFRVLESLEPDIWLSPHTQAFDFEAKLSRSGREGTAAWVDPDGYRRFVTGAHEKFRTLFDKEQEAR